MEKRKLHSPLEVVLWSIALPGVGQFLNGHFFKGALLLFLEFLINIQAHLNMSIVYSFQGMMMEAIQVVDYQWLMFYPCHYLFSIWDAYYHNLQQHGIVWPRFEAVPFVVAAYITTIGTIYSNQPVLNITFGPIFLPIISCFIGFIIGRVIRRILLRIDKKVSFV